jgi:hypothetical protein
MSMNSGLDLNGSAAMRGPIAVPDAADQAGGRDGAEVAAVAAFGAVVAEDEVVARGEATVGRGGDALDDREGGLLWVAEEDDVAGTWAVPAVGEAIDEDAIAGLEGREHAAVDDDEAGEEGAGEEDKREGCDQEKQAHLTGSRAEESAGL